MRSAATAIAAETERQVQALVAQNTPVIQRDVENEYRARLVAEERDKLYEECLAELRGKA